MGSELVRFGRLVDGCLKMENDLSLHIERTVYEEFMRLWSQGNFEQQRLGQAFYNHFKLHKVTDQTALRSLYEADGEKASDLILRLVHLH